jgi:hypothetical protein
LSGRNPRVGTKEYLRTTLLKAGWDAEHLESVLNEKFKARDRLVDVAAELRRVDDEAVTAAFTRLKAHNPVLVPRRPGASVLLQEVWDSYTRHPWWVGASGGRRTLAVVNKDVIPLARTTACFVRDLWLNLGEAPEMRLPVVRRFNLLSWTSTEALTRFQTTVGPATDLAVVYGGLLDEDHIHQTFSYLEAMASSFSGVLLYEAAIHGGLNPEVLLTATRRAGVHTVLGVGRG